MVDYKLFIDDERFPVEDDWVIARTSQEAIDIVEKNGLPTFVSFDHDLGGEDTSMIFIRWLTDYMIDHELVRTFQYFVHSQNPIGRNNIEGALVAFDRMFPPSV